MGGALLKNVVAWNFIRLGLHRALMYLLLTMLTLKRLIAPAERRGIETSSDCLKPLLELPLGRPRTLLAFFSLPVRTLAPIPEYGACGLL